VDDAVRELWTASREVVRELDSEPTDAYRDAVREVMEQPRPGEWGGEHGDASTAYLDDVNGAGWVVAALVRGLRGIATRRRAGAQRPQDPDTDG
jgi:hypothetical protein